MSSNKLTTTELALIAASNKAVKVDSIAHTKLTNVIKDTENKYHSLVSHNIAAAAEIRAEIDSFLKLDWTMLENTSIPIATRDQIFKKASRKVLDSFEKAKPIFDKILEVKDVIQRGQGDSLVEIHPSAQKAHGEIQETLKIVEDKVQTLEANWKEVTKTTKKLLLGNSSSSVNEDGLIQMLDLLGMNNIGSIPTMVKAFIGMMKVFMKIMDVVL